MTIPESITTLGMAYRIVYVICLLFLICLLFGCLVRAIKGPGVADRIVAVNMMGTMVMVMIAILALLLEEGYLVDICIIYAMISFLAVIVLTKVYLGIYLKEKVDQEKVDQRKMDSNDGICEKVEEVSGRILDGAEGDLKNA